MILININLLLLTLIGLISPFAAANSNFKQWYRGQLPLQHEVTVTLKLVQVYVTDKKGNPVTDLSKEDFQLFDNGKLQELTDFERHILFLPDSDVETKSGVKTISTSEILPQMSRKFLLFFDFAFNNLSGILKAKRAALNFIKTSLDPTDEVGLISFGAIKGLTLHEFFTKEHQKVQKVIEAFGAKEVLGRAERIARDYWDEIREAAPEGSPGRSTKGHPQSTAEVMAELVGTEMKIYEAQVKNYSSEIGDLAKALRYVPGIKYVVFFSGGVANLILYGASSPQTRLKRGSSFLRDLYETMARELASSNCAIYTVNTQGIESSHFKIDSMGDVSLRELARLTGGMYFDSAVNYEKIAQNIQNMTGSYYVLGYYVDENWDGKFHKLKVEVQRKGCKVFGQSGYFNPKPYPEYTELEKTLHLIDLALNPNPLYQTPRHFRMIALPFSVEAKPNLMVIGRIKKEGIESFLKSRAEIITFVFDKPGNLVKMQTGEATKYGVIQDNAYLYSFLSLPPGSYDCRVVIIDLDTGRGAVASSAVIVPESRSERIQLFPPLLLCSYEGARYIRVSGEKKDEGPVSLSGVYAYDLARYVPILEGFDRRITKIWIVVRCLRRDVSGPEIELSIDLQDKDKGKSIPLSFSVFSRTKDKNYEIISLKISTGELSPGEYSLHLEAKDPASNSTSQVSRAFTVK